MLERALKLKTAYNAVCNGDDDALNGFKSTNTEWTYIDYLKELLERFDQVTKKVSGSTYPTISLTIAYYNTLMDHIEDFSAPQKTLIRTLDSNNPIQIRLHKQLISGAEAAYEKIKKYYSKTDLTAVYYVTTAMDCRMKFNWWMGKNWEQKYLDLAKSIVTTTEVVG